MSQNPEVKMRSEESLKFAKKSGLANSFLKSPPTPLLIKGGQEGISGRAGVLRKILAAGCGSSHLRIFPQK